jgi:mRNA-degrading endonuclease toxin of MazEF toxin-antitoxin module
VVLAAAAGDYGKPRPWLVVQADKHNHADRPNSILLCLLIGVS